MSGKRRGDPGGDEVGGYEEELCDPAESDPAVCRHLSGELQTDPRR
jgi:hypothetical protein